MTDPSDTQVFYSITGPDGVTKEYCNEELAVSEMLHDGPLFISYADYDKQTKICVLCNDLFAWGCSDAEDLPVSEIGAVYKLWKADPMWGTSKWCCHRRNLQPQPPVKKAMQTAGSWDEAMEKLPRSPFDEIS